MATTPGAPRGYDHDDASMGRAHYVRSLAPVTMLPPGLCAWEEWVRRGQHRVACIEAVKRSADYIAAVAQDRARPETPDPWQPEVSKRAWEKSVRQWRMDMKALVADGLAGRADDEPLRVPWPSELSQPLYVPLPASLDEAAFVSVLDEPLHAPWPSERVRRRSRSPHGANEECNEPEPEPVGEEPEPVDPHVRRETHDARPDGQELVEARLGAGGAAVADGSQDCGGELA